MFYETNAEDHNSKNLDIKLPKHPVIDKVNLSEFDTSKPLIEEKTIAIVQELSKCLNLSPVSNLGELLEEKKRQVAELETIIFKLDKIFTEKNIDESSLILTFETK